MLRIATLGAVVVAAAALRRRNRRRKRTSLQSLVTDANSQQQPSCDETLVAAHPSDTVGQAQSNKFGKTAESQNNVLRKLFLKLIRLLLSVLFSALLHAVLGKDTPTTSVLLLSIALFLFMRLNNSNKDSEEVPKQEAAAVRLRAPVPKSQVSGQDLNGLWIKDKETSDSMESAFELLRLNGLLRRAIRLIKGVYIRQSSGEFELSVLSGILWFKVTERYPMDGSQCRWKRRDLRRGQHVGSVHVLPNGALQNQMTWPEPCGGSCTDMYFIPSPGTLWVDTELIVGGEAVRYRQVYRKQP